LRYPPEILLIIIGCLFLQLTVAQNFQKIDSLELALGLTANKKDKIEILLLLSDGFSINTPDKALEYAEKALNISDEINYEEGKLKSANMLAKIYEYISDFKSAYKFAEQAKEMAEELEMERELINAYHVIGYIYRNLGSYDKSSEYFFECLKLSEKLKDKKLIAKSMSNIGSVYFNQLNFNKALEYYLKSMSISKEINDRNGIARGLNNIAIVYGNLEEDIKLSQYLEEAADINKELGNRKSEGINYMNLGVINRKQKNYDVALKYFQQALSIFENLKHTFFIARCQINLGDYFMDINDIDRSLEYVTKAFETGKKHGLKKIVFNSAELLNKIYLGKSDTLNAFMYDIIKYRMKDSLDLEEKVTELSRLELKYEFNKKEQEKRIEQQRKDFIILIIIIILIFGLIVIILIFARQRIKAKNVSLEKQNIEVELNSRNKEFTTNVMYLMKKNEMLSEISEELVQIKNEAVKDETKVALKKIANKLQKSKEKDIWEEFELRFNQVHIDFYKNLTQKFPELTSNDLRLCAFLKLNMSSKEISEITGQQVTTLDHARSRIRKKLGISKTQIDLITFLSQI